MQNPKSRRVMTVGLAVTIGCALAGALIIHSFRSKPELARPPKLNESWRVARIERRSTRLSESAPLIVENVTRPDSTAPGAKPPPKPVTDDSSPPNPPPSITVPAPGKPALLDPIARVALAFVGTDLNAEVYWLSALNDPTLPANERKDLIEDLNEVGLSDPENPGPDDLPVILFRMLLLEEMGAMDQVNEDAMKEAYKDLGNLALLASGVGGRPVK